MSEKKPFKKILNSKKAKSFQKAKETSDQSNQEAAIHDFDPNAVPQAGAEKHIGKPKKKEMNFKANRIGTYEKPAKDTKNPTAFNNQATTNPADFDNGSTEPTTSQEQPKGKLKKHLKKPKTPKDSSNDLADSASEAITPSVVLHSGTDTSKIPPELQSSLVIMNRKRILLIADVRGALNSINTLARNHRADVVVHTGDFGFYDGDSADKMSKQNLIAAADISRMVEGENFTKCNKQSVREAIGSQLSELPLFLAQAEKFDIPVYTTWGGLEDNSVIEKLRNGTYTVPNLHIVDEYSAPLIKDTKIRLLSLPGSFIKASLFNIGEGTTVPGVPGKTWATMWQIGELLKTFKSTYSPDETRIFLSDKSPVAQPLLNYLVLHMKPRFTVSASKCLYTCCFADTTACYKLSNFVAKVFAEMEDLQKIWQTVEQTVQDQIEEESLHELITSTVKLLTTRFSSTPVMKEYFHNKWNFSLGTAENSRAILTHALEKLDFTIVNKPFSLVIEEPTVDDAADQSTDDDSVDNHKSNDSYPTKASTLAEKWAARIAKRAKEDPSFERLGANKLNGFRNGPVNTEDNMGHPSKSDYEGDSKFLKKQQKNKKAKEKKKKLKQKITEESQNKRPGLWFKNGDRSPEEILSFLAEEDRMTNPTVNINLNVKPNGSKSKVALVFFDTVEQASRAYERVDKDAAGTVSIYQPEQSPVKPN